MGVERAARLYLQGFTLRQIGAELDVPWTAVSRELRSAASSCVAAHVRLIPPPHSRSWIFVTKA